MEKVSLILCLQLLLTRPSRMPHAQNVADTFFLCLFGKILVSKQIHCSADGRARCCVY